MSTAHDPVSQSPKEPREKRQWWAVIGDSDEVVLVWGHSCGPNNPGYWWCPEIGASMNEQYHLFATEAEALDKLITELHVKHIKIEEKLEKFRLRRIGILS